MMALALCAVVYLQTSQDRRVQLAQMGVGAEDENDGKLAQYTVYYIVQECDAENEANLGAMRTYRVSTTHALCVCVCVCAYLMSYASLIMWHVKLNHEHYLLTSSTHLNLRRTNTFHSIKNSSVG
jgi:hypothetical protein